jgi:DNA-directed RNA polymerase subunit H (RpoH/RPB5)
MDCAKIKSLLSEYADGVLDPQNSDMVQKHLVVCKSCAQELSELKALIKQLNELPKVKASDDFLQKVHQRIERRDEFEGIMRKLFSPAKIKLPAEIAGVLVTALIVIGFFQVLNQDQQLPEQFNFYKTSQKRGVRPVELTFVMNLRESYNDEFAAAPAARMADTDWALAKSKNMESKNMVREEKSLSVAESMVKTGVVAMEEEPVIASLRALIESQGGKIISIDRKADGLLDSIIIEILPAKFPILLEKLKQLGKFQTPLPSDIPQGEIPLQIRLKILD